MVQQVNISSLIRTHDVDRYYKAFKTRTHLIVMLFGILSRCDSMTETCEGLRTLGGKLNHLGLEKAPAKSTSSKMLPYAGGNSYRNQPSEELTAQMIKICKDAGYRGWYGIESSGRQAIMQGKALLKKYL